MPRNPEPPNLVFLPGLANDAEVWSDVRAHLRRAAPPALQPLLQSARVSDVHSRHADLPRMAQALLAEESGTLLLVGHSMGGILAQHVARAAPLRVAGLALLGTTARPDTPEMISLRSEACGLFAEGLMDEVLQANVRVAFHPDNVGNDALVARYVAIVRRAGAAQLIAQNQAVMARDDNRPHLGRIDTKVCPTLVLCGQADALTPPELSQEIVQAVPGARLALVARCGHMLTLEQPQAVAALLLDWLAEHFAGRAG